MNYYDEIKEKLLKGEIYDRIKDYSKSKNKVKVYFETGKLLSEAGKQYGKNIIKQYSEKLMIEVGKKYNERTLYGMRKFYEVFCNEKLNPLGSKLSWSHYRELLVLKNIEAIRYYIYICEKNKLIDYKLLKVDDLVPNPILIKINPINEILNEYTLKQTILNNLDEFLLQIGYGFTYVGNEYKIKYGNKYNYIDLLLFNYEYNCFVVIELKVTELKKEHIGQIQFYMNYIDNNLKNINQDKTIGIIICRKDNKYIMEYCSDNRIIAREYNII